MINFEDDCPVKIAVRERPLKEDDLPGCGVVSYDPLNKNMIFIDERRFAFDMVFTPTVSQKEFFTVLIRPMIDKALMGYNCTALAYGQTGTGKTFTMGLHEENFDSDDAGVVPRCLYEIFKESLIPDDARRVSISVSFIEIYNEKVYDLLSETPLEQINTKGHKFLGGVKHPIQNVEEGYAVLVQGNKNRHVRPTKMNPQSSRSHAIFTLHITTTTQHDERTTISSCFHFVDLAGSEGVKRTGHQGAALTEGVHINQGLLSIGKVLQALVTEAKVIPYRDSVLSSVLQDSLNINSYLSLLACISPHRDDLSETLSTLRFAQNAKSLRNTPQINSVLSEIKKPKARTPLRIRNGPLITPMHGKRWVTGVQRTETSVTKRPLMHSSTFCTPSKIRKIVNEKINQSDFGLTPKEKLKKATNYRQNRLTEISPIPQFNDHRTSRSHNDTISSITSIMSLNLSTSTALDTPVLKSYSPLMKKCMAEFENKLEDKLEKMMDTFREISCNFTQAKIVESTPGNTCGNVNGIPRDFIQNELRTIVRQELKSLTTEMITTEPKTTLSDCTSADTNRLHCQLFAESSPIFKVPEQPAVKIISSNCTSIMDLDSSLTFLQDGNKTVMPNTRRSVRLSLKNPVNNVDRTVIRRSARLSMSIHKEKHNCQENQNLPKKGNISDGGKRGIKGPTENKVIASYFRNRNSEITSPAKNKKDAKSKHQKAIFDLMNKGSIKELQILPQIGLKTAYQIVTYRTLNGKFKSFDQIAKVPVWRGNAWKRFKEANNIT